MCVDGQHSWDFDVEAYGLNSRIVCFELRGDAKMRHNRVSDWVAIFLSSVGNRLDPCGRYLPLVIEKFLYDLRD